MGIKTQLLDDIKDQLEHLSKLQVGTEEYKVTVNGVATLMDKYNDIEKAEFERKEQINKRESEYDLKSKEFENENKNRRAEQAIEWTKIGTGVAVPLIGLFVILKWEETGTITTALRGYVNNFIPKKLF